MSLLKGFKIDFARLEMKDTASYTGERMEDAPEEVTIRITLLHLTIIGLYLVIKFHIFSSVITKHAENKPESLRTILEEVAGWESTYSVLKICQLVFWWELTFPS